MDDQTPLRIHLETEAILGILAWCEAGQADLLHSVALNYEVAHNPHPVRKAFAQETLANTRIRIEASDAVAERARDYGAHGIKALDALHLACAVEGQAQYFCTCDDRFLKRAKQMQTGQTQVFSPLELIEVISPW